jgi:hypothetical protein
MKNHQSITIPNFPPLLWRGAGGEVKTLSLCNTPFTPNKKGDCYYSHHPRSFRIYPQKLALERNKDGKFILVTFLFITKTRQMYALF